MTQQKSSWGCNLAVITAGFFAIAAFCYFVSRDRILWSDELFGWMLITDPTWHHMIAAWRAGADGGGIAFYTLARLWMAAFGRTVLSFRAFSAFGCFVGFSAVFLAMRRFYSCGIAAVAVFLVWFGSHTLLWQMVQTRFYGLMLGGAALALLAAVLTATDPSPETGATTSRGWFLLGFTAIANLILVGSHPFGVLYSAAILFGAALSDALARRRRFLFYLFAIAPWTLLLASRQAMLNSAKVGQPHFWTTRPYKYELLYMYVPAATPWLIPVAIALLAVVLISPRLGPRLREMVRARATILLPALVLALMPFAIWLISQRGTSYFVDRYLLPFTLGIAVLIAEGLTQLLPEQFAFNARNLRPKIVLGAVICYLLFIVGRDAVFKYPGEIFVPPFNYTPALAAELPHGLPVVFVRADIFDMMMAEQRSPSLPMYYLLDWNLAIAPDSPRWLVSAVREMQNWKKVGYFSGSILETSDFLAHNNRFVVVDDPGVGWFKKWILSDPRWQATRLGDFNDPKSPYWNSPIWMVQRR